jgi:hypothetical protein
MINKNLTFIFNDLFKNNIDNLIAKNIYLLLGGNLLILRLKSCCLAKSYSYSRVG